jgi:hypothetical protein
MYYKPHEEGGGGGGGVGAGWGRGEVGVYGVRWGGW